MKKVLSVFFCLLSFLFNITAYATEIVEVYADDLVVNVGDTIIVPVNIKNNAGIMGFKLTFTYDENCFTVLTVDRGELTQTGNFNDNHADQNGTFDVVWNDSEEHNGDGSLLFLQVEIKKLEDDKAINLSYSKEDTFNENWQDVNINCSPIKFLPSDTNTTGTTTTTKNTEKTQEQKNDTTHIKTAVDAAKKQAQIEKISDLTDGEKDAFIESVNFYLSAFTGTVDNDMDTLEKIQEGYNASLADRFVQSALECIDSNVIIDVIESVFDEKALNSINKLSEKDKKVVADTVYAKLKEKSKEVSMLPENTTDAYNAVKSLYEQARQMQSPFNWKYFTVIISSFVVLFIIVMTIYWVKKRKNTVT